MQNHQNSTELARLQYSIIFLRSANLAGPDFPLSSLLPFLAGPSSPSPAQPESRPTTPPPPPPANGGEGKKKGKKGKKGEKGEKREKREKKEKKGERERKKEGYRWSGQSVRWASPSRFARPGFPRL